jgi:hypothetical protein
MQGFIFKARSLLAGPLWLAIFLTKTMFHPKNRWFDFVFLYPQILVSHGYPS